MNELSKEAAWQGDMFRLLAESVPDYAIFILDAQGRVRTWSDGARSLLGYAAEEIVGQSSDIFYTLEDIDAGIPEQERRQAVTSGRTEDNRWHVRKDGSRFWSSGVLTLLPGEAGQIHGFARIMRDRTDQKLAAEASEALHRPEQQFRIFAETVQEYALFLVDPRGIIATWNLGAERIKGWKAEEIVGQYIGRLYLPEERDAGIPEKNLRRAAELGHYEERGWRLRKDGSRFLAHVVITPIQDAQGTITGFAKVTQDITDSMRTEERLRSSEERLRALIDNLPQGAVYQVVQNPQTRQTQFTFLSAGIEKMFGVTPAEAIADGSLLYRSIHAEDIERVLATEAESLRSGSQFDCEFRHWYRSTEIRWAHCRSAPRPQPTGEVIWEGVILDVTDRKRAEESHRRSEEQFRAAFELAAVGNVQMDAATGRLVRANRKYCELTGYSADELLALSPRDLTHPDDREADWKLLMRLMSGEIETYRNDKRYVRKDGRTIWVNVTASLIRSANGTPLHTIAVVQDLTERRAAEEALRTSERRFRRLLEANIVGVGVSDAEGAWLEANDELLRILGYSREELQAGKVRWTDMTPKSYNWLDAKGIAEAQARGACTPYEKEYFRKDGSLIPILIGYATLDDGRSHFVCFVLDLTQRKHFEQELNRQQRLLQTITDNAPSMLLLMDPQGRGTFVNPAVERITGYKAEELIGAVLHDKIHHTRPDGRPYPKEECPLDNALPLKEVVQGHEDTFVRKDGSFFPVRCSARPVLVGNQPLATVIEVQDITEEKQVSDALRESEERFRATFNQAAVGVAIVGMDNRTEWINPGLCSMLGYSQAEMEHRTFVDVTHPDDLRIDQAMMKRLMDGEPACCRFDKRYVHKDGSIIWADVTVTLVRDAEEKPRYAVAVVVDITERKRVEDALQEASRRKDEFLAMLAHELRNPLAPIRTGLDLLAINGLHPQIVEPMQQQVVHLVRLVDDLLDVSRIMRGWVELKKEPVQLATVLQRAIGTIQPLIQNRHQKLTVPLLEQPVWINADPVRLVQVITNLLHNSSKYNYDGGAIAVTVSLDGAEAVIAIADTGIGIEPDLLPRIFDVFTQATRSIDRSQGGLGIGLTLVKKLVEMHDGVVTARSGGPGSGSEFIVRLPIYQPSDPNSLEPSSPRADREQQIDVAVPHSASCPNLAYCILVVDDNVAAATMLAQLLKKLGKHDVFTSYDGPTALRAAREHRPDIILLDIGLPELDGYEVARRLRALPEFEHTLIVALTGYGTETDRQKSLEAGCDDHLVKPPAITALAALLTHPKLTR